METLIKLKKIDRRIIFLLVAAAVALPLLFPSVMDVEVSSQVRKINRFIDELPERSLVWMGFDYWTTTLAECDPSALAVARHCFSKNLRIVALSVVADGVFLSQKIMKKAAQESGKTYGVDYAVLGYRAGGGVAILAACQDLRAGSTKDVFGAEIESLPIMRQARSAKDFGLIFEISDNSAFNQYVTIAATKFQVPMAGATTAVSVPDLSPYVNSGQLIGLLGGMRGAAEYEKLIAKPDLASRGLVAQSTAHLLTACLIVLANLIFFLERRRLGRGP
jgi:hypothetical protein